MKKIISVSALLLSFCLILGSNVFANGKEPITSEPNYIWILEAEGGSEHTLAEGQFKGVRESYSFSMQYVSLAGTALSGGSVPTRFVGGCTLHGVYDFSGHADISKALKAMDHVPDLSSQAWCSTHIEPENFEYAYDGSFALEFHFHASESSFTESEELSAYIGENSHAGVLPGRSSDHGLGDLVASVYINAEPDESELGYGTSHGVRAVMVLVTVCGGASPDSEFSFELSGTLKRIPCNFENIYSVKLSPSAPAVPDIEAGSADGKEALGANVTLSRIRSSLSGRDFWPFEFLPDGFPELYNAESLEIRSATETAVEVKAVMTASQLSAYKAKLKEFGLNETNGVYYGDSVVVKIDSQKFTKNKKTYYNVSLSSVPTVNAKLTAEFAKYFPEFTEGYAIRDTYGSGTLFKSRIAWIGEVRYGIDASSVNEYCKTLEAMGFECAFDEWTKREGGYLFRFNYFEQESDFGKGYLLYFSGEKEEQLPESPDNTDEKTEDTASSEQGEG